MQDRAQAALPVGIELAGCCDGCLDKVGKSATRCGIRGQQLRQRLNCGAFVNGQDRPLLAHGSLELNRRDLGVRQKQLAQYPRPKNGFDRSYRFIGLSCFRI